MRRFLFRDKRPSVFLQPLDICNIYSCLTRQLRQLGSKADFLDLSDGPGGGWDVADSDWPVRFYVYCKKSNKEQPESNKLSPAYWPAAFKWFLSQTILILWVALRYDVVVLKSGMGIGYHDWDLKLYKRLGKTIIAIFQGSDSRPPYLRIHDETETPAQLKAHVEDRNKRVRQARSYATHVVDNPLSGHNHHGRCCIYQIIGIVVDQHKLSPTYTANVAEPEFSYRLTGPEAPDVRVLHAPSSPLLKGTDRIRECIRDLIEEGCRIDYCEITGRPNAEVMKAIKESDFVIDELYSDIHGATFATEACALGKPTVVCGYGKEYLEKFVPKEVSLPTVFDDPSNLKAVVRRLVQDKEYRERCGKLSLDHMRHNGSSKAAAERLLQIAEGNAPEHWFFDSREADYPYGVTAPKESIAANIRKIVDNYGEQALLLEKSPQVKQRILEFAYNSSSRNESC